MTLFIKHFPKTGYKVPPNKKRHQKTKRGQISEAERSVTVVKL